MKITAPTWKLGIPDEQQILPQTIRGDCPFRCPSTVGEPQVGFSMALPLRGHCLCGAIKLTVAQPPTHLDACHCRMCRRWGGGPALGFPATEVRIEPADGVATYDSSAWAQRSFCPRCGSHLYWRARGKDLYFLPAGLFDDLGDVTFTEEVYVDHKPDYYSFANSTRKLTEAETLAAYASAFADDNG